MSDIAGLATCAGIMQCSRSIDINTLRRLLSEKMLPILDIFVFVFGRKCFKFNMLK